MIIIIEGTDDFSESEIHVGIYSEKENQSCAVGVEPKCMTC